MILVAVLVAVDFWYTRSMENRRTLEEELASHGSETVFIGARSSFFFIGPADEAREDLSLISAMLRRIASLSRKKSKTSASRRKRWRLGDFDGEKLGRRKVIETYKHDMCGGGKVILIEGKEFGMFWTRHEYLAERERLLKTIF